jgi:phage major head subunit gpT-like protein
MSNKSTRTTKDQSILSAIATHYKGAATIVLGGTTYTPAQLSQVFQSDVDAASATQSAKTAYKLAVAAEKKTAKQASATAKALRSQLIGTYGADSAIVADFGFTPKARTVKVKVKAEAIQKSTATREARGTKGKRQRLEIKGSVPAVPSAPSAPTPARAGSGS